MNDHGKIWQIPHESGGTIAGWMHYSSLLKGNPSGFSPIRPHRAFIPPHRHGQKLPVLYALAPWTQSGRSMLQWEAFREDLPTRIMRLISSQLIPECVLVCPDLYTDFGGSQFVDSAWVGPHAQHIIHELIPFVEANFEVLPGSAHRGVFGRSSGGFGALRLAMDFPGSFAAVGCHAGDMGFDWVYRRSLIDLCTALAKYQDANRYLLELSQLKKLSGWDTHVMMLLGACAFFSPNSKVGCGFDLPIDLKTAEVIEPVYARWIEHDPVMRASRQPVQEALTQVKSLFIDCGNRDQYYLQYGSRKLASVLTKVGINHTYQEFDDNHSGTAYRYDVSLPLLTNKLV